VSCSLLALSGKQPCKECIGQTRPHKTKEPHPSGHIKLPLMALVLICVIEPSSSCSSCQMIIVDIVPL
jgi:hypothetical protein